MRGNTIRTIRREYGFSQEVFAKIVGVPRSTLAMIELEKRKPPQSVIQQVNRIFDLDEITKAQTLRAQLLAERMLGK